MLIRIKQNRSVKNPLTGDIKYGTDVELGHKSKKNYRVYKFRPANPARPEEDHVCDINDSDDIQTLLAIKEGYEIHPSALKGTTSAPKAPPPAPEKPAAAPASPASEAVRQAATTGNYQSLKKPDLMQLVAKRTGKKPHATTSVAKLIETLEALDKEGQQ
jgi:hypothetical protein